LNYPVLAIVYRSVAAGALESLQTVVDLAQAAVVVLFSVLKVYVAS
jgi:hypothetical protein